MPSLASPFGGEDLLEIPLPDAPLVRVIAQVKFPEIASVARREFVGPFQEAIRSAYPILREERGFGLSITPEGISHQTGEQVWRFHNAEADWRVSLAPTFVALETDNYSSRDDFFQRFDKVIEAVGEHLSPAFWERLGVRYVDRVDDEAALARLSKLVRPEVLGLAGTEAAEEPLQVFLCHAQFSLDDGAQLLSRTGILPGGAGIDPSIDPSPNRSWILDLDISRNGQFEFNAEGIGSDARNLAARVYHFFRWAVTPEFLTTFGASLDDLDGEEGSK